MPYSNKPESVERVIPILDVLLTTDMDVALPSANPHRLTYWLYNAIATAAIIPEFQKYAALGMKFKFRVRSGQVVCEHRSPAIVLKTEEGIGTVARVATLGEDVDSVTGIIGMVTAEKLLKGYFPNAVLSTEELAMLHRWTSANGYHIINHEEDGVTVTKEETELEWKP